MSKNETLERIFRAKRIRRKELSRLPFKKKIEILVQLQKMARGIKRHSTEKTNRVWII